MKRIILVNDSRVDRVDESQCSRGIAVEPRGRREQMRRELNMEDSLISYLERFDWQASLFDGYEDDLCVQIRDPVRAAEKLYQLIVAFEPDLIVFDLECFGQVMYGYRMLEWIDSFHQDYLETKGISVFVASRWFGSRAEISKAAIRARFPFVRDCIERFDGKSKEVGNELLKWAESES